MAINRDIAYYIDFKNKRGWDMRFEIIPAGENKAANTFTWTRLSAKVTKIENAQFDFDDLPLGIMKAPTLSISFDFNMDADANLQELLLQPHYTTGGGINTSNVYNLITNYGDGTQPRHFLFSGGQSLELGNEVKLNKDHEMVSITVQSIDLVKLIMETTKTADFCAYCVANLTAYSIFTFPTIRLYNTGSSTAGSLRMKSMDTVRPYKLVEVFGQLGLGNFMKSRIDIWLRRSGSMFAFTLSNNITRSMTFKKQTTGLLNTAGTDITDTDLLIIGRGEVSNNGVYTDVGLFYADSGGESFHDAEYLHELIADIAECFCVKFKWHAGNSVSNVVGGTHYVNVPYAGWYKPFENSLGSTQDLSGTKIISDDGTYQAVTASNVFRSAEVEHPNVDGDNLGTVTKDQSGISNTSTWNTKAVLYSMPLMPDSVISEGFVNRTHLRTMLYEESGVLKSLHGSTKIDDGYHSTYVKDSPVAWTDLSTVHVDSQEATVKGWVLETQRTNTASVAITEWIVATFSSSDITKRTLTYDIDGTKLSAWSIGDVFILDAITGSNAGTSNVLMSMKADWIRGTATCEFVSIQ